MGSGGLDLHPCLRHSQLERLRGPGLWHRECAEKALPQGDDAPSFGEPYKWDFDTLSRMGGEHHQIYIKLRRVTA